MSDPTTLETIWFLLICVLWIGYFVLEGFDFGVGMLLRVLGRDETEKRLILHSIGPLWDGNEVWLIVAGGATFAAFPDWYATLFSGFYIPLFLIVAALIMRNVAFEFWGKEPGGRWRSFWEWSVVAGSAVTAVLWGVAWANIVRGVPIVDGNISASLWDLLSPYALLGGIAVALIFLAHGAIFLSLRVEGDLAERARSIALRTTPVAALAGAGFLLWTLLTVTGVGALSIVLAGLAAAALALAGPLLGAGRAGAAFSLTAVAIAALFSSLFAALFPNAIAASTGAALTLTAAASSHYTLTVMTIVTVFLLPIVLLYQGWTYWVFRKRLGRTDVGDEIHTPIDLLASATRSDRERP